MGARQFAIDRGAVLKIEALEGDSLRVRFGDVWVTQHGDSKDYLLRTGDSITLSGKGETLAMAYKSSLLDLHREEARDRIAGDAGRAEARGMRALLRSWICGGGAERGERIRRTE